MAKPKVYEKPPTRPVLDARHAWIRVMQTTNGLPEDICRRPIPSSTELHTSRVFKAQIAGRRCFGGHR